MIRIVFALVLLLVALPASAADRDHSQPLLQLLRGIDTVPGARALTSAAKKPEAALFRVALDSSLSLYVRRRAVSFMSAFKSASSERYLGLLSTMAAHVRLRWIAIYTNLRTFGPSSPAEARVFAETLLHDKEPLIREAVVRGLRYVPGKTVDTMLKARSDRETNGVVKAALKRVRSIRSRH